MRSGPILRTFKAYELLPDSMKQGIAIVEEFDKSLVSKIATVSFKIDSVEMLKLNYLGDVGQESPQGAEFLKSYNEVVNSPCNSRH